MLASGVLHDQQGRNFENFSCCEVTRWDSFGTYKSVRSVPLVHPCRFWTSPNNTGLKKKIVKHRNLWRKNKFAWSRMFIVYGRTWTHIAVSNIQLTWVNIKCLISIRRIQRSVHLGHASTSQQCPIPWSNLNGREVYFTCRGSLRDNRRYWDVLFTA